MLYYSQLLALWELMEAVWHDVKLAIVGLAFVSIFMARSFVCFNLWCVLLFVAAMHEEECILLFYIRAKHVIWVPTFSC